MKVLVEGYLHRPGEHCATTALRNILHFHGLDLSEAMIFGLSGGLGFYYILHPRLSPTRMFHGRSASLEADFCENVGIPFDDREEADNGLAWLAVKERVDAGKPIMVSTDTYYLGYHHTTSHFPRHRAVVVGYDDDAQQVLLADRKFEQTQVCSYQELAHARNAPDYPMGCRNQYGDFLGEVRLGGPLAEAITRALRRNAEWMLAPSGGLHTGVGGMRTLARGFSQWGESEDWSWAARFGYQVIVKRGSGGSFFRSLHAEFLEEAAELVPSIAKAGLPKAMNSIAARWRDLAAALEEQSERESCDPTLFVEAGRITSELADREEAFFRAARISI